MFFRPKNSLLLAGTKLNSTYKSLQLTTAKGGRKGGVGVKTPSLELDILQKLYFLRKGD